VIVYAYQQKKHRLKVSESGDEASTNVLWIRNWRTLLHTRWADACVHSPDSSTFLSEITLWPTSLECDDKSKISIRRQAMQNFISIRFETTEV